MLMMMNDDTSSSNSFFLIAVNNQQELNNGKERLQHKRKIFIKQNTKALVLKTIDDILHCLGEKHHLDYYVISGGSWISAVI